LYAPRSGRRISGVNQLHLEDQGTETRLTIQEHDDDDDDDDELIIFHTRLYYVIYSANFNQKFMFFLNCGVI
jgi:hypothetical protein